MKMTNGSSRQTWTERTHERRLAFIGLLSEPKSKTSLELLAPFPFDSFLSFTQFLQVFFFIQPIKSVSGLIHAKKILSMASIFYLQQFINR